MSAIYSHISTVIKSQLSRSYGLEVLEPWTESLFWTGTLFQEPLCENRNGLKV
jgi:hypothetical protein